MRPEQGPGCQRHGSDRVKSSSSGGCPFALGISLLKPDGSNIAVARRWMTIVTSARPIADMIAPTPMNRVAPITGFRMVFNQGQLQRGSRTTTRPFASILKYADAYYNRGLAHGNQGQLQRGSMTTTRPSASTPSMPTRLLSAP